MKRLRLAVLIVFIVSVFAGVAGAQEGLSRQQIETIAQSVVRIVALDGQGTPFKTGSGTIVTETGQIFTNHHVVEGASDFEVHIVTDMNELPVLEFYASLIGISPDPDLLDFAVLQIDRNFRGRPVDPQRLGLSFIGDGNTNVSRGDSVTIFGFPDIAQSYLFVADGSITTIMNAEVEGQRIPTVMQTDAPISPGNSGGMAVNADGEFIGIPTWYFPNETGAAPLGGIVSIQAIDSILDNLVDPADMPQQQMGQGNTGALVGGISVDCGESSFTNGVQVTVNQMRAGFNYTATVIGLNGFDPVLAVYDPSTGDGRCADDTAGMANYQVSLPSTGVLRASNTDAQITFSQNLGQNMADVSLVVGGFGNGAGEFILLLDGMAVTNADGAGDPFSVLLTPGMVGYGAPLNVYMISKTNVLDPLFFVGDPQGNPALDDNGDVLFFCDDAGTEYCSAGSVGLSDYAVPMADSTLLGGGPKDAMVSIPLQGLEDLANGEGQFNFFMTSYQQETYGDYVMAFHVGTQ